MCIIAYVKHIFFIKVLTSKLGRCIMIMTSELGMNKEGFIMDKEEILKASREENKNKDLAEIEIENKAVKIGLICSLILITIYYCLEIFIKGEQNNGFYSVLALYCGIIYGYKGLKMKKKFYYFTATIWLVLAVGLIYEYIKNIFITSTIL